MNNWLLLLVLSSVLSMRAAGADAVDDAVRREMERHAIPGVSLAVLQDGKIIRAQGYGVRERGGSAAVTAETLFQAASISKPVTALAALRLVQQGKLSLDEDVNAKLRAWKLPENDLTAKEKVTLRRLLSHTAGLTVHGFPGYRAGAPLPTLVQVLDGVKPANTARIRVDQLPGSQWRYSGGGYTVLQQLLQDVSGQPFSELLQESVLRPLGMTASAYSQPLPPEKASLAATAHRAGRGPVRGKWHVYPELAAAGLWTTPSDLLRFAVGVQQAAAGAPGSLLSRNLTRQMLTAGRGGVGLGVFLEGSGPTLRFSHGGRNEGFDCFLIAYAEGGRGAAVMINTNADTNAVRRIVDAVALQYGWPGYTPLVEYHPIEDREPEVTAGFREILDQLGRRQIDRERFAPELADVLAERRDEFAALLRDLGKLKAFELVERGEAGPNRTYRYRARFRKETGLFQWIVGPEGKVVGLELRSP